MKGGTGEFAATFAPTLPTPMRAVVALSLAFTFGCTDGPAAPAETSSRGSYAPANYTDEEYGVSSSDWYEIEAAQEEVEDAFDELEYHVSRFSDGSTNWRYVVADAEYALDDLDRGIRDLEDAVSDADADVDLRRLRSRADALRYEIESFRVGADWDDVVPLVEQETWDLERPIDDLEDDIDALEVYDEFDAYDESDW